METLSLFPISRLITGLMALSHTWKKDSIRIVYEDNAAYWGQKIDVLVKKGREDEVISSLGLIVAALAKEPRFYEELPLEVKEYIRASTDTEEGYFR